MNATRPPSGTMILWRPKGNGEYRFGYCTYVTGYNIIRLGDWNGDTIGGKVVDINDIEWMPYR